MERGGRLVGEGLGRGTKATSEVLEQYGIEWKRTTEWS